MIKANENHESPIHIKANGINVHTYKCECWPTVEQTSCYCVLLDV